MTDVMLPPLLPSFPCPRCKHDQSARHPGTYEPPVESGPYVFRRVTYVVVCERCAHPFSAGYVSHTE